MLKIETPILDFFENTIRVSQSSAVIVEPLYSGYKDAEGGV